MKLSKILNRLIFNIEIGDGQKIKFRNGTSINNGKMKLKITSTRCYVSVEKNICLTSYDYYLKDLIL